MNLFVLASDEHMCVESPKHELRCPLIKKGVITRVLSNNKWFRAYKKLVVTHVLTMGHLNTSFGDWGTKYNNNNIHLWNTNGSCYIQIYTFAWIWCCILCYIHQMVRVIFCRHGLYKCILFNLVDLCHSSHH